MKGLLTGVFGNVGVSAIEELLGQGHAVRCFDLRTPVNQNTGSALPRVASRSCGAICASYPICWPQWEGVDVVLHVAFIIPKMSHTGVESELRPDWAEAVNVGGTRQSYRGDPGATRPSELVFTSSLHIYGRTQDQPPPRTVSDPVAPIEKLCLAQGRLRGDDSRVRA